ncbi:MAG: apolipoprotein N-acyltransferase [Brevundimonas sp.]|uniref:apolipoprotein N-acyltransferase n=1 Tax=Brevundimonas sp. TaxID=1871086 RepID=UPI002736E133|nr:apolipoprotein N-acyltransferase [Brevundimonas sp.]MDP3404748.1 apolipoprotein N-acyltransferase [Brevundimonas sp.]
MMDNLATSLRPALSGRFGRIVLALAAGIAAALAHPPFGMLPGLLAYPLLMILAERSGSVRGAFWMGWLAGFGYFGVGCWWVAEAFLVNPAQAWMGPFAASLLPAGIGLFWGMAAAVYRRIAPPGLGRVVVFAALFALFEWLRGHVLTGFPWNPAGASWAAGSAGSQFAAVSGVYGLGFVTVAAVAALGALGMPGPRKARAGIALAGATTLAALLIGGGLRLAEAEVRPTQTLVRIVQADVQQESKWTPEAYRSIVDRYVNLTARQGAVLPDVVVWPEGALPASFNDVFAPGAADGEAIARAVRPGQTLLAGLARAGPGPDGRPLYYNSLIALSDEGGAGLRVAAVYDKHRLVPFGEYLPLGRLMGALGVRSLVHMPADFSPGPRPAPIIPPNVPAVQPLICYESLYPGFTPGSAGRPDWIVNVSNDAWFGATSGPLQHLNLASYRAIETGLPVVRATPTGVSAMIDPWGRVVGDQRLDSGESGVIDAYLPQPVAITPYGRFGDLLFWLMVLGGLLPSLPPLLRRLWRLIGIGGTASRVR